MADDEASKRAAYYREMAARARAKAETVTDLEARRTMQEVAMLWEQMASNAERSNGAAR